MRFFIIFFFFFGNVLMARNIHLLTMVQPSLQKVYQKLENAMQMEVNQMAKALNIKESNVIQYEMMEKCCFNKGYLQNFVLSKMNVNKEDIVLVFVLAHGFHKSDEPSDPYPSISLKGDFIHYNDLLGELLLKRPSHIFTIAYTCNHFQNAEGTEVNQKTKVKMDSLTTISKITNPASYQHLFEVNKETTTVIHFFSSQINNQTLFEEDLSGLLAPFVAMNYFTKYGVEVAPEWNDILSYMAAFYASKSQTNCPFIELLSVTIDEEEGTFNKQGVSAKICEY